MKTLHITSWYPNRRNDKEAIWVKNHIDALNRFTDNDVLHLEVRPGTLRIDQGHDAAHHYRFRLTLPIRYWVVIEIVNFLLLWYFLWFKYKARCYRAINFHIAYPQLTYIKYLKHLLPKRVFITEHWSAYHFNFGVSKPLPRVAAIFKHGFPLITVSHALGEDIRTFSGLSNLPYQVVPNIVDTSVFYYDSAIEKEDLIFMVSGWKPPKDPFTLIRAFSELVQLFPSAQLAVGGFGPQWEAMRQLSRTLQMEGAVQWLGKLDAEQIVDWQQRSRLFVHCSDYETFSVVTAEALCCGTPVVASAVGGINELIDDNNGIRVKENTEEQWKNAIIRAWQSTYDYATIAKKASACFSSETVGRQYADVICEGRYA